MRFKRGRFIDGQSQRIYLLGWSLARRSAQMLGATFSFLSPARVLLVGLILAISLFQIVYSISANEEIACQALWEANRGLSSKITINASRCCEAELSIPNLSIICAANNSAISIISIFTGAGLDIEFQEFQLFESLQSLSVAASGVKLRSPQTCLPTGLNRLPNLTSLTLDGFACSPRDDYFANFRQLHVLTISTETADAVAPYPGISLLNSTLQTLGWSGINNTFIPSSWTSLNLTSFLIDGIFERSNMSNFIAAMPFLKSLTYLNSNPNDTNGPILPPLPGLEVLDVYVTQPPITTDAFYGFDSLQTLTVRGFVPQFPSSAFQLQNLRTLNIYPQSTGPLEDPTDSWNATSLSHLEIGGSLNSVRFPSSMNNLTNLKRLVLNGVALLSLPANLSGLVNLQSIAFENVFTSNETMLPLITVPNITEIYLAGAVSYDGWFWEIRSLLQLTVFTPQHLLYLSPRIGNLVNLMHLELTIELNQEFPAEMSLLTNLRFLSIDNSGSAAPTFIPSNWTSSMPLLEKIYLRNFQLATNGSLPNFGEFTNLRTLYMEMILGVTAPINLTGATLLEGIFLDNVVIARFPIIPDSGLPFLKEVSYSDMGRITEPLPLGYYRCSNLRTLYILRVPSSGNLSPQVSGWTRLELLYLELVNFTGTLPIELFQLPNLDSVYLRNMRLITGVYTVSPTLHYLLIEDTGLSDLQTSAEPPSAARIVTLDVLMNRFTAFPSWISQASSLNSLTFQGNGISSQPFPDLTGLINLRTLFLDSERFTGSLPDTFDRLARLRTVSISGTELSGVIPPTVFTVPSQVALFRNRFTSLPSALPGNCSINTFVADTNSLSGPFNVLDQCRILTYIDLSSNSLGPVVPASILTLPRLNRLLLAGNAFSVLEAPGPGVVPQPRLTPGVVNLQVNNFSGPITDAMLKTIIDFGFQWSFDGNRLECPRHLFYSTLSTWNKTVPAGGSVILTNNHLCLPGNTSAVACPSLFFGPGPAQTGFYRTFRTPCRAYSWVCNGSQPALDAPCIAPGVWFVLGSIQSTVTQPLVIGGNTTVQGNFTVPTGTSVTIVSGATVTVQGCVSISGDLTVDVSQNRPTVNGSSVDVILYDSSVCNSTQTPDFGRVTVIGGGECAAIEAQDRVTSSGLSVVFTVYDNPRCRAPAVDSVSSSTAAIVGGVVGSIVVVGAVVAIVLIYKFRDRVVPSFMLHRKLKHFSARPAK